MTDESPQPIPQPQPETLLTEPQPVIAPAAVDPVTQPTSSPKKSKRTLWIILGVIGGLLACCCLTFVITSVLGAGNIAKERGPVKSVLDSYMRAMEAKDVERAYALFAPRAQRQVPISKFEELIEGNNYVLFEGYKSIEVVSLHISRAFHTNPDQPQGIVATVSGTITFAGSIEGSFNGTLEKVNDEWQIDAIFVTVPPSKIE